MNLRLHHRKFSQASTNALQDQINALRSRHSASVSTVQSQLSQTESFLASERARSTNLQDVLDELCVDVAREAYGRRREVALRLALLTKEEAVAEALRRWVRRAKESYDRWSSPDESQENHTLDVQDAFHRISSEAESLLAVLDAQVRSADGTSMSAAAGRIAVAQEAVKTLKSELHEEVKKRVAAVQRWRGEANTNGMCEKSPADFSTTPSPPARRLEDESTDSLDEGPSSALMVSVSEIKDDVFSAPRELAADPVISLIILLCLPCLGRSDGPVDAEDPCSSHQRDRCSPSLTEDESLYLNPEHSPTSKHHDLLAQQDECLELPSTSLQGGPDAEHSVTAASEHASELQQVDEVDTSVALLDPSNPTPSESVPIEGPENLTPPPRSSTLVSVSASLSGTKHRYDGLQHGFRDCSLALRQLKQKLGSSSRQVDILDPTHQLLRTALMRIDDYAEDARVELEIRIADEELAARGFETLLSVPDALVDADERVETEAKATRFVNGTDEDVRKALERFGKKLEDVQHDVAILKHAVHEALLPGAEVEEEGATETENTGWSSWTAGLLRTASGPPRPTSAGPTFSSVVFSPRFRRGSSQRLRGTTENGTPFADLGLRIPMPPLAAQQPHNKYGGLGLGMAPGRSVYSIGLGARSSSMIVGIGLGSLVSSPSPARSVPTTPMTAHLPSSPLASREGPAEQTNAEAAPADVE